MKKLVSLALSLCIMFLTFSATISASALDNSDNVLERKGDVNRDGKVNIFDIMEIRNYIFGKKELTDLDFSAADVNEDYKVDIFDIMEVRDIIFGKPSPGQIVTEYDASYYMTFFEHTPSITSICSVTELNQFYNSYKDEYLLDYAYDPDYDYGDPEGKMANKYFSDNSKYDESFFSDNFLLIIPVWEASGSNRHNIKSIFCKNNILKVTINRLCPFLSTDDICCWFIILELDKQFAGKDMSIIFEEKQIGVICTNNG